MHAAGQCRRRLDSAIAPGLRRARSWLSSPSEPT
jgi:hypothetical protein